MTPFKKPGPALFTIESVTTIMSEINKDIVIGFNFQLVDKEHYITYTLWMRDDRDRICKKYIKPLKQLLATINVTLKQFRADINIVQGKQFIGVLSEFYTIHIPTNRPLILVKVQAIYFPANMTNLLTDSTLFVTARGLASIHYCYSKRKEVVDLFNQRIFGIRPVQHCIDEDNPFF